jgi:excisionase family DNA binding protein
VKSTDTDARRTEPRRQQSKPELTSRGIEQIAYRVADLPALLGFRSRSTAYEIIRSGKLKYFRLEGGEIRISRAAIDNYMASE